MKLFDYFFILSYLSFNSSMRAILDILLLVTLFSMYVGAYIYIHMQSVGNLAESSF